MIGGYADHFHSIRGRRWTTIMHNHNGSAGGEKDERESKQQPGEGETGQGFHAVNRGE